MAMDPNMLARLAMSFGGRMAQGSGQPGGTIGSGLGAGFQGVNQDMMQMQQQEQMQKIRAMQMQQMQQQQMQQQQQQAARQQIAAQMQQQGALGQPQQQFQQQLPQTNNLPGGLAQGMHRPVPPETQMIGQAIESGDFQMANFLQAQQHEAQAKQEAEKQERVEAEIRGQEQAAEAERMQYKRQQDSIKNSREIMKIEIDKAELAMKQGKAAENPMMSGAEKVKTRNSLYGKFTPIETQFLNSKKNWEGMKQLALQETGTSDNQLVVSMIKMHQNRISNQDYQTAVTGVEGLMGRFEAALENYKSGQLLTKQHRKDILKVGQIAHDLDSGIYRNKLKKTNNMLKAAELDDVFMIDDYSGSRQQAPKEKPKAQPFKSKAPPRAGRVFMSRPDGSTGYVPENQVEKALKLGWSKM